MNIYERLDRRFANIYTALKGNEEAEAELDGIITDIATQLEKVETAILAIADNRP